MDRQNIWFVKAKFKVKKIGVKKSYKSDNIQEHLTTIIGDSLDEAKSYKTWSNFTNSLHAKNKTNTKSHEIILLKVEYIKKLSKTFYDASLL